MNYEDLCVSALDAMEQMEKIGGIPRCITLSPKAFNLLAEKSPNRLKFFGMNIRVDNLPCGVWFVCSQETEQEVKE
jgi:hypothetical protein